MGNRCPCHLEMLPNFPCPHPSTLEKIENFPPGRIMLGCFPEIPSDPPLSLDNILIYNTRPASRLSRKFFNGGKDCEIGIEFVRKLQPCSQANFPKNPSILLPSTRFLREAILKYFPPTLDLPPWEFCGTITKKTTLGRSFFQ